MRKYFILDTSSLLRLIRDQDKLFKILNNGFIAVPRRVIEEIRDSNSKIILDTIRDKISIIDPSPSTIHKVLSEAKSIGSIVELSMTDISIVALAIDLISRNYDIEVLSEDFDIQNLCEILGIPYSSVLDRRIKKKLITKKKCLVCGKVYDASLNACPFCGSNKYRLIKFQYGN